MKTKYIFLFLFTSVIASCQSDKLASDPIIEVGINDTLPDNRPPLDTSLYEYSWNTIYNPELSLVNNIHPPKGYKRLEYSKNSFADWLRHLPLKIDNTVYLHNGEKKYNQTAQFRVLDIDVGSKDLQQCADAVMRLRAEYLYTAEQYHKIHFKYTNGVNIPFLKWGEGFYPSLKGNKVVWVSSSNNSSYKSFKKYMNNIFMYAGTASLEKELESIILTDIKAGDVLIKGGFPGHAVTVLDVAENKSTNDKVFILAQSYMPAQNIHVLKNFNNNEMSPWYSLKEISDNIKTPEWTFYSSQLKRFKE